MGSVFSPMGDLGRKGPFGRRRRRRGPVFVGPAYGYPYDYPEPVYAAPIEEYFIISDASGKPVASVAGRIVQISPGFTFRRMSVTEGALVSSAATPAPMGDASIF